MDGTPILPAGMDPGASTQGGPVAMTGADQAERFLQANPLVLVYFSLPDCGVCHAIRPRLMALADRFKVPLLTVSIPEQVAYAAQHLVFAAPTVLVYYQGREIGRESRFIDFRQLAHTLSAILGEPED